MQRTTPITVVFGRFDDLLARGLRDLIESDPNVAMVATDVEHSRIPVVLRAHHPDVAILDAGALGKLAEIRELLSDRYPGTRLVLLADTPSETECSQALAFGASAFLGRDSQSRDVLNAIHLASRGLQLTPRADRMVGGGSFARGHLLTEREAEVLPLLQLNRSNAQIAVALQIGVETVRTHARNIYRKLGVSSRRQLVARPTPGPTAREAGLAAQLPRHRARLRARPRREHGSGHK
ncbi:MAG TPA: response regulator transcription factor [Solirubrobacteraceae bacterium]|jgi:DNA-binding NarL/FixJ family response regulator|nr:response regulator transcription factor [Solirubrobacteraceae bacterium]